MNEFEIAVTRTETRTALIKVYAASELEAFRRAESEAVAMPLECMDRADLVFEFDCGHPA